MDLPELYTGTLIQRYKRFLADIKLENGENITAFCANSGSMLSCKTPGSKVKVSLSDNPKRKHKYTWEMIEINDTWVGINTHYPNKIVYDAIVDGQIPELTGYTEFKREVAYGKNSRIDILLTCDEEKCYVEVKNVTLARDNLALFPDAVTSRGTKHLKELMDMVDLGHRAVMFYLVQRNDTDSFEPAADIDPLYAETLAMAKNHGVEILVYQAEVTPSKITIIKSLPYNISEKA